MRTTSRIWQGNSTPTLAPWKSFTLCYMSICQRDQRRTSLTTPIFTHSLASRLKTHLSLPTPPTKGFANLWSLCMERILFLAMHGVLRLINKVWLAWEVLGDKSRRRKKSMTCIWVFLRREIQMWSVRLRLWLLLLLLVRWFIFRCDNW